jgi:hypothetical protein
MFQMPCIFRLSQEDPPERASCLAQVFRFSVLFFFLGPLFSNEGSIAFLISSTHYVEEILELSGDENTPSLRA